MENLITPKKSILMSFSFRYSISIKKVLIKNKLRLNPTGRNNPANKK